MPEYTTQFNLPKALANENVSLSAHNSLVEAIDTNIGNSLAAHKLDKATSSHLAHVKPDGTTITADLNGVISAHFPQPIGSIIYQYKNQGGSL
jgi:hypothetical protein